MNGRWAAALALAASVAACAASKPKPVDFSEAPRSYVNKDYPAVYNRWTRHDRALNEVDVVDVALEVWGTFKSWDYRQAYIEHYAAIYSLSQADRSLLRQAQMDSFRQAYEFHLTAQSANYKWNDLEKKDSAWRITLVDGLGHELAPEYVRVERLPDAYESDFFPAKTPFTKSYAVRFPASGSSDIVGGGSTEFAGAKSGSLTLRIASPIGRVELGWQSK
ncbi:MAG TPA: hypothetical protein VH374_22065 [Polyangia bacterium]|jgi:hypothetical protein|nr:hypothetical protein [Polyangia bacterium]